MIPDTPRVRYLMIIMTTIKQRHMDWPIEQIKADAMAIIEDLELKLPIFDRRRECQQLPLPLPRPLP